MALCSLTVSALLSSPCDVIRYQIYKDLPIPSRYQRDYPFPSLRVYSRWKPIPLANATHSSTCLSILDEKSTNLDAGTLILV